MDVPAARDIRRKFAGLVGAADSRRRYRALAAPAAPTAPIDERDIAAVAVRALCEDGHDGAEYVLTGPQSLSQFEQLSTIGRVVGRTLRVEEMPPDEARREGLRPCARLSLVYCSTPGLPLLASRRSLPPQSRRSPEHRHGRSSTGRPITLRSFERDGLLRRWRLGEQTFP